MVEKVCSLCYLRLKLYCTAQPALIATAATATPATASNLTSPSSNGALTDLPTAGLFLSLNEHLKGFPKHLHYTFLMFKVRCEGLIIFIHRIHLYIKPLNLINLMSTSHDTSSRMFALCHFKINKILQHGQASHRTQGGHR